MLVEMPPRPSMQSRPVSDICVSACQVGCAPLLTNVSANSGTAAARQSQAKRSNIGAPARAPQQDVADRKTDRRDHQHGEGANAEIIADGAADHKKADCCNADADGL